MPGQRFWLAFLVAAVMVSVGMYFASRSGLLAGLPGGIGLVVMYYAGRADERDQRPTLFP